jgi:formylglycine-generating enzyme required for sulfatase activity
MDIPRIEIVPGGWFLMGSEKGQENERPCHWVWVDSFGVGKFPVTNRDYAEFVRRTEYPEPPFWRAALFSEPEQPVVGVSWDDAVAYCRWLSNESRLVFRLPTEAEWERAARAGRDGAQYPWGDEPPEEKCFAGCDQKTGGPLPVGANEPNGFGVYDMSEGVHEWCSDFYDYSYYRYSPQRNPQGPEAGRRRSSRGGSWRHRFKFSRCAARSSLPQSFHYADYGFRVAMTIE